MLDLSPGKYWMAAPEYGTGITDKGKPYFYFTGDITYRADDDAWIDLDPPIQRTIWLYLTDKAMPFTADKLDALGFNGDFSSPKFEQLGDGIVVAYSIDRYQGKQKERWDLAIGNHRGFEHDPIDIQTIRRLNAEYKRQKGTTPDPPKPQSPAGPSPATEGVNKDDIPF